jgi:hypothetical protein
MKEKQLQSHKHHIGFADSSIQRNSHRRAEKVENTSTAYRKITGSNWKRKLVPKAH